MKLLALDTATEACSAALYIDGEISSRYEIAPRRHSNLLLPMVDSLMVEADIMKSDLDALAFGRGPGSFMGVRIATGVTQGIAFALSLPVVPVSSLASMAMLCHQQTGADRIVSAIDARMNEVYLGCYEVETGSIPTEVVEETVMPPEQASLPGYEKNWVGAGTGWASYQAELEKAAAGRISSTFPEILPSASTIAEIAVLMHQQGLSVSAAEAVPVYLRNNVAKTTLERELEKSG